MTFAVCSLRSSRRTHARSPRTSSASKQRMHDGAPRACVRIETMAWIGVQDDGIKSRAIRWREVKKKKREDAAIVQQFLWRFRIVWCFQVARTYRLYMLLRVPFIEKNSSRDSCPLGPARYQALAARQASSGSYCRHKFLQRTPLPPHHLNQHRTPCNLETIG